jgi:hypothetical protein
MWNAFYRKMLDAYIEQAENSAQVVLAAIRDVQALYVTGTRMVLRAGRALGKRSRLDVPLAGEVANLFEDAVPAVMKAQYDLADASINAGLDVARSMRDDLAARASAGSDEHRAQ